MKGFNTVRFGIALCLVVIVIIFVRGVATSAIFVKQDRINILFYSAKPIYYSFEKGGEVHYLTTFTADSRTHVPGGYGIYRIGALGKLSHLEKKEDLFQKTFSRITGSMIDYTFYPSSEEIYYGTGDNVRMPSVSDILFLSSNASVFDRVYIVFQFMGKHLNDFEEIHIKTVKTGESLLLSDETFAQQYLGYFYHKSLRSENKTVQILYQKKFGAAKNMSRIIDGEGIRVVDIDVSSKLQIPSSKSSCIVMENKEGRYSTTARELADFFHCILKVGKGRVSDIVIELGSAEKEWE